MTTITLHSSASLAEKEAGAVLAERTGATVACADQAGDGFNIALASRGWVTPEGSDEHQAWIWLRRDADGKGELIATQGSHLFTGLSLLEGGLGADAKSKLASGALLPATFSMHRPHYDSCMTQYWRSARGFDDEAHIRRLAETGFTHCEVNSLQAHLPYEETVEGEFYPQFYTYCAGFNHFVSSKLTEGLWPQYYLEANLTRLKHLSALAKRYGLKPGLLMFEPRNLPEKFFVKYPTLRGARIDHPFRSRLPRYCLAQDHPISQRHYREVTERLMEAVPELDYLSVWSNDSGAGFEHTSSLYVGRNGGPYMIREWRDHDNIAQTAGQGVVDWMENIRVAAAKTNPDFDVILRLEPFKNEHDTIVNGLGGNLTWEGPSMLVKGYDLPYPHPKYPENMGVAGSIYHTTMDESEGPALAAAQAKGIDPVFNYSGSSVMNQEPLIGLPTPRLVYAKMKALADIGANRASCFGSLAHTEATPFWPNPVAIRAAQFQADTDIEEILLDYAGELVGEAHASTLNELWREFEETMMWQPIAGLYSAFGFCWQRTFDRPYVPNIEAVPEVDRRYYEKQGCFQHNNPGINDLGRDVLFDLITQEQGEMLTRVINEELLPRIDTLLGKLDTLIAEVEGDGKASMVFVDLRDRTQAYRHWIVAFRNVGLWCATVYGYTESDDEAAKAEYEKRLQAAIDEDLENTAGLIELLENHDTEVMVLSATANNTYFYGENLPELLRKRIELTTKYRHEKPQINKGILWRPVNGTSWPEGWMDDAS
jgi:hypothetical protein